MDKALVIVPTYNERDSVEAVVTSILENAEQGVVVLVVDDSSPDRTGDIVERLARTRPRIHFLRRPAKDGPGTTYLERFTWALEGGC